MKKHAIIFYFVVICCIFLSFTVFNNDEDAEKTVSNNNFDTLKVSKVFDEDGILRKMYVYNKIPIKKHRDKTIWYLNNGKLCSKEDSLYYNEYTTVFIYNNEGVLIRSYQVYNDLNIGAEIEWYGNGELHKISNRIQIDTSTSTEKVEIRSNEFLYSFPKNKGIKDGRNIVFTKKGDVKNDILYCKGDTVKCLNN